MILTLTYQIAYYTIDSVKGWCKQNMKTLTPSNARKDFYNLLNQTIETSEPCQITTKNGNVIVVSEEDWDALQETLYLLSIPGMKEKITEGMKTPIEECESLEDIGWDIDS